MSAGFDVVAMGEVLVELSAPGPLDQGSDMRLSFSGDALNAAGAAAAAGARVALLARIGDDELGDRLVGFVRERGIDTSLILRTAASNGVYFVGADPDGTREFVYVRRGSAGSQLDVADVEAAGLEAAGVLVVSGITQALSASCRAAVDRATQLMARAGRGVVYDPNFRGRLTTPEQARAALAEVAPRATVVTPSCPGDTGALLGITDPVAASAACVALGARAAAVTSGPAGVVVDTGDGPVRIPAVPAPRVVDATGAGDVFSGTLAARLALGDPLMEAVRLGAAAASLSLAGQGGSGYVATLDEIRGHLGAGRVVP